MRLQEYQSKSLFAESGIPIPQGYVADTPEEARRFAQNLAGAVAVKAQVLVGGRGKAGGIRLADTPAAAEQAALSILGMQLGGLCVNKLLVEEAVEICQEIYLAVTVDRDLHRAVVMVSVEGGVEIEQVAHNHPEAIVKAVIDPVRGLSDEQTLDLASSIGLADELYAAFGAIAQGLYEVFTAHDALLAEINPLAVTTDSTLLALDGKVVLDDNALFRHPELDQMRADGAPVAETEAAAEREAREAGVAYVYLGGEIGCIVNGAGLAMATMDVIQHFGGTPANFLDVGGGANSDRVALALRLVLGTPGVKGILLNIFGGITHCDDVARGVVAALDQATPDQVCLPLVVRLVGTNQEQGQEILNQAGYRLTMAKALDEAARKVVALASGDSETERGTQGGGHGDPG
jgi:succinyl-CoA synthetase beta subunit